MYYTRTLYQNRQAHCLDTAPASGISSFPIWDVLKKHNITRVNIFAYLRCSKKHNITRLAPSKHLSVMLFVWHVSPTGLHAWYHRIETDHNISLSVPLSVSDCQYNYWSVRFDSCQKFPRVNTPCNSNSIYISLLMYHM